MKVFDCQTDIYFANYSRFFKFLYNFSSKINAKNIFSARKIKKKEINKQIRVPSLNKTRQCCFLAMVLPDVFEDDLAGLERMPVAELLGVGFSRLFSRSFFFFGLDFRNSIGVSSFTNSR